MGVTKKPSGSHLSGKNMEAKKGRGYTDVVMIEVKLWHALEKFETVQCTNYWNSGMIAGLTV